MDAEMQSIIAEAEQPKQYRVKRTIMSRRNPTSWVMGWVLAGKIFTPVDGRDGWLAIASNKWIPASACELVDVPVEPEDDIDYTDLYGVINLDYDQSWPDGNSKLRYHVSRPTRNQAPRAIKGLPATARFMVDTLVTLTPDLQQWIHIMCRLRSPGMSYADAAKSWASLMKGDRMITNKTGSGTHADYVNGTNLDKEPMRLQPMGCGGTIIKIPGSTKIRGEDCWEIEVIDSLGDYRQYTPETHPYLFFQPTNSVRVELKNAKGKWTGKYRENKSDPFPQYEERAILPLFGVGTNRNAIQKWRVKLLGKGDKFPSAFVK